MTNTIEIELKTKGASTAANEIKLVKDAVSQTVDVSGQAASSMNNLSSSMSNASTSFGSTQRSVHDLTSSFSSMLQGTVALASSIMNMQNSSLSSSFENQYNSLKEYNEKMLSEYDDAIVEIEERYAAMKESMKEEDTNSLENLIINLEHERQLSISHNDIVSAYAIGKKLEELEVEKAKEDAEKKLEADRLSEIKRVEDEKTNVARQAKYNEAMLEYKKDKAEYDNNLANAKMNAALAVSDAISKPAMAALDIASGTAKSFSQGGLVGAAAGAVMGVSILASVLGSVGSAVASANAIKDLEANPPQAPAFAYGTMGYTLGQGESAIVGERGPELVHSRGGELVVENNLGSKSGLGGDNITLNFYGITMDEAIDEIKNFLQTYKNRDVVYSS